MRRPRAAFIVTFALAGCSSSEVSATGDASAVNTCPAAEPVAGSACSGDPTSTPGDYNHGCDFSRNCGQPGAHYDALYSCVEGRWMRSHSNGCNPPPPPYDAGVDARSDAQSTDADDAAAD